MVGVKSNQASTNYEMFYTLVAEFCRTFKIGLMQIKFFLFAGKFQFWMKFVQSNLTSVDTNCTLI